jgi:hypothetical protein
MFKTRHVSVSIDLPAAQVYEFASNPENLPAWASGLGSAFRNINGEWIAESPMGRISIKFCRNNDFGVLDHDVTLPSGETINNPMRVVANNDGSEMIFTLYQRPGMSNQMFDEDAAAVTRDFEKLKSLLEKKRAA